MFLKVLSITIIILIGVSLVAYPVWQAQDIPTRNMRLSDPFMLWSFSLLISGVVIGAYGLMRLVKVLQ
jgi:hypothetical protein